AADFVLGRFAAKEREVVDVAIADAVAAAACWASKGVTEAMNQYNGVGT
ncbi:MAG: aminoacyl-tRNA hydrolase, partial [Planctomycetota bacterium]